MIEQWFVVWFPERERNSERKTKSSNLFHRTVITGDILRSFGIYAMEYYKFNSFPGPCSSPPVVHESSLSIRRNNTKFPRSLFASVLHYYYYYCFASRECTRLPSSPHSHPPVQQRWKLPEWRHNGTKQRSRYQCVFYAHPKFSLSLALSFSLYAPLALSIPKLTQHRIYPGMEGGLLGCLFALSPLNNIVFRPLTHPPTLPSLSACPPAMPWGLESCRMRRSSSLG